MVTARQLVSAILEADDGYEELDPEAVAAEAEPPYVDYLEAMGFEFRRGRFWVKMMDGARLKVDLFDHGMGFMVTLMTQQTPDIYIKAFIAGPDEMAELIRALADMLKRFGQRDWLNYFRTNKWQAELKLNQVIW